MILSRIHLEPLELRLQPGSLWETGLLELWLPAAMPREQRGILRGQANPVEQSATPKADAVQYHGAAERLILHPVAVPPQAGPHRSSAPLADSLAVVLASFVEPAGPTIQKADGTWYGLEPLPTPRQEIATAALNGDIYVIGGYDAKAIQTDIVEVYNLKSGTWRTAAPLPVVTDHNVAAVAGGTLYALAGSPEDVFAYDPTTDSWNRVAPMRYAHGGTPAIAVIEDKIYVAGGFGFEMKENEVEVYDPVANTWTLLAPMNVARNHTTGGAIGGQFYVVGGRDAAGVSLDTLEVYDPASNTWAVLTSMPTARSGIGAGVVNDCLYVFGGELPGIFGEVEVYNPATDSWHAATPMPTPRHGIFATTVDNAIFIAGGGIQKGLGASSVHEVFVVE